MFYSIILYFGTRNNIDKLQLLQNKCLRVILRCDRFTSVDAMLNCLGLMRVKEFLFLQTMSFIYKLYHLPSYLEFTVINETHDHNTRNGDNICILREWEKALKIPCTFGVLRNWTLCRLMWRTHRVGICLKEVLATSWGGLAGWFTLRNMLSNDYLCNIWL